ncbi:unnamed protein product [Clavelina lepadiformis]|uniref:DUF4709 domain-containing protein n=1 Tax=Clavelina lepadiformis TaxID=159417 RepID=A0ABP0GG42_CLALP
MALSILTPQPFNEDNNPEDLLAFGLFGDEYENSLRPSIADNLQVGFLASDQFTQTYDTEILDIKHMTETVKTLVEDMARAQRDLQFSKQVMKAAFEQKLQNKAFDLYTKVNDKLKDLQNIHEERVAVVRRSFKQQLQDALVKMAAQYKKYYEDKLAGKLVQNDSSGLKKKISALQAELSQNQSIIQMMEIQMEKLESELQIKSDATEISIDTSEIDALQEENSTLKSEVNKLNEKVEDLSVSLEFREEKIKQLGSELMESKTETENEKQSARRLAHQVEDMKKQVSVEKLNNLKQLDQQKLAMERDMASKLANSEAQAANSARERQKMMQHMEIEMERCLLEQRKKHELRLAEVIEEAKRKTREIEDSKTLGKLAEQQKAEIRTLRQRLAKSQKQWEKKFAILRASLHALKDESYIRLQLQKQAATLKYASISYGPEGPIQSSSHTPMLGPGPTQQKPYVPAPKPLPSIKRGGRFLTGKKTNTIPSGVGTEPFSGDEDDQEEIEENFIPLPPKPNVGDYMPSITN